ncbi:MAG TPA: hypothetical protein VGW32_02025 [Pyrinomonadaceae bacterium]|nr:hypothetical protein [Pyrinomonadaceae bacterium]
MNAAPINAKLNVVLGSVLLLAIITGNTAKMVMLVNNANQMIKIKR